MDSGASSRALSAAGRIVPGGPETGILCAQRGQTNRVGRMQIDSEALGAQVTAIRLAGRLDSAGVETVEAQFVTRAAATDKVLVDLSAVDFIASGGISMLIAAARDRAGHGGRLVLCHCQPRVQHVLATAGLDSVIPIYSDRDGALGELGGAG